MTVLSLEEFNKRSHFGSNSHERIYQGKPLEQGPVFALSSLTAAQLYCTRFTQKAGAVCIVVQERNFLKIWSETRSENAQPNSHRTLLNSKPENNFNSLPVTSEFVAFCQKLLAEQIGPIANVICKKTLAKKPDLNRVELVAILAKKIPDPHQAQKFQQLTLE